MKIVSVMNEKGGIGKTITASSIAYILAAECKKRVLVIDGDQQGNASQLFGEYEPEGRGLSELLEKHRSVGGEYATKELIVNTVYENVDIIPSNGYLMRTNMLLMKEENDQIRRLVKALEEVEKDYDYCICDCGLILDMTVTNILIASDLVIAPVKLGGFEVAAVENLKQQISDLRQISPDIQLKVLITMRQANKASLELENWLKANTEFKTFRTAIRRSVAVEKSTIAFKPLPVFSKNCIATKEYREVVRELLEDMEG